MIGKANRAKRYNEYKDPGVGWLDEVPRHWDVAPVYARYEVALGKMLDARRLTGEWSGRYVRNVDVQWDAVSIEDLPVMDFTPSERERYLLRPGDLLVCEGGEVGRTAVWSGELDECFYQKAIHRLRPRSSADVPRFFFFLMYALARQGVFTAGGNPNTIDHLTAVQLRHHRVPFPPATEQASIANFLDRETAKIDALVAKKERLIELLQEKRTGLITLAVTQGLDPNVPMKNSGVEWLRAIPAHWDVKRVKNLSAFVTSGSRGWAEFYSDEGPLFLRIGNVQSDSIDLNLDDVQRVDPPKGSEGERTRVRPADILVSITALVGAVAVVPQEFPEAFVNQHLALVRPSSPEVGTRWLAYCVTSPVGQTQFASGLYGGAKDGLGLADVRSLFVLAPPVSEQECIVAHLDSHARQTSRLVQTIRTATNHLKELRTALISAAVTGKIDVREAAPR